MIPTLPPIDPKRETRKITTFLKQKLQKKAVIGLSGGIDSTTVLFLLLKAILPRNIIALHLPYFEKDEQVEQIVAKTTLPKENFHIISIQEIVDAAIKTLNIQHDKEKSTTIRRGNVMARVRMITLFDVAKKHNALVVGTENKSEHLLGYFTRFGDEASDIEPLRHLYKTHVYQLASHLDVAKEVIAKHPSADLWSGQTDEKEMGFSYKEADQVLYCYFDKKLSVDVIKKKGFQNAEKIITRAKNYAFKHETPYTL